MNKRESFALVEVYMLVKTCDENRLVLFHIDDKTKKGPCTLEITPREM